jgi:uncharacterized glyoxalase superfamily protein PhnB
MRFGATMYVKNSSEAVEFYQKAFGLTLGDYEKNADGTYLHAPLLKNGVEIFAVSETTNNGALVEMMLSSHQQPITIYGLAFDHEDEVKKAYQMLVEGGRINLPLTSMPWSACCGEVVDKYGVAWFVCIM